MLSACRPITSSLDKQTKTEMVFIFIETVSFYYKYYKYPKCWNLQLLTSVSHKYIVLSHWNISHVWTHTLYQTSALSPIQTNETEMTNKNNVGFSKCSVLHPMAFQTGLLYRMKVFWIERIRSKDKIDLFWCCICWNSKYNNIYKVYFFYLYV